MASPNWKELIFVKYFLLYKVLYSPYWPHIRMAWEKQSHPNLHFIFFEDMKADINEELRRLNEFLGCGLTQQQLDKVCMFMVSSYARVFRFIVVSVTY